MRQVEFVPDPEIFLPPALLYWSSFFRQRIGPTRLYRQMDTYLEFAGNHSLLVSALAFSFFILIFTELQRKSRGLTTLEPQAAVNLINADAVVIDLRSPEVFARGHIVNAKNMPFEDISANKDKISKYAKKAILAVCDAGTNSAKVVDSLRKSGIENVYGLKGGINAWTQANLPLVTGKKTKKKH